MPASPSISVLMAAHNAARFLPDAIHSVLRQSLADFEFVLIDDASTDQSNDLLNALDDPRIRVIHNQHNLGLTASLNIGLAACRGPYIARLDADDIATPDRLARQFQFMEQHPDYGIVGSSRSLIDDAGRPIGFAPANVDDLSIRWKCLLGNPLPHPTVMLRKSVLDEFNLSYDETYRTAQDYQLWTRLLAVTKAHNLEAPLTIYRIHAESTSQRRRQEQLDNHDRIALSAHRRLLPAFKSDLETVRQLRGRYGGNSVRDNDMDPADAVWLHRLGKMFSTFVAAQPPGPALQDFITAQKNWMKRFASPDAAVSPFHPSPRSAGAAGPAAWSVPSAPGPNPAAPRPSSNGPAAPARPAAPAAR